MKRLSILVLGLTLAASSLAAESTKSVLAAASAKGRATHTNVMVIFHASWCGWCHKLDDFLTKSEEGKLVSKNFQIVHITVMEDQKHKDDENPGGMDLLTSLHGDKGGIPFMAIIDSTSGKTLITSNTKGETGNMGYPGEPQEIEYFAKMLRVGAPQMRATQVTSVTKWLHDNAPKSAH